MTSPNGLWALYVATLGEGKTQRQVGEMTGVDQATVGRWLRGEKIPTEAGVVAKLAQGFGRNPLEAFVAAGFLSVDDAGRGLERDSRRLLASLSDRVGSKERAAELEEAQKVALAIAARVLLERDEQGEILGAQALTESMDEGRRRVGLPPSSGTFSSQGYVEDMIAGLLFLARRDRDHRDDHEDDVDQPQVQQLRRGMPGGAAPLADAARTVNEEPGLTKARREHDEETERIEDDRTGMEPL